MTNQTQPTPVRERDFEKLVRELTEAGWKPYKRRHEIWQAPSGDLRLGPYGAWKAMKAGAR